MASYLNPQPSNAILDDIANIRELENYNAQSDPSLGSDFPVGAKRFINVGTTSAPHWQWQRYDGTSWKVMANTTTEKLMHNVDMLDGYHASTSAVANTIPVYNSSKLLVGGITGNAATATKLATARNFQVGGIASGDAISFNGTAAITLPINSININNANDDAITGVLTLAHGGTGRTDGWATDIAFRSINGESLGAKNQGQIGRLKYIPASTDLNTLVQDGIYAINGSSAPTLANHWPETVAIASIITVRSEGQNIFQEVQIASARTWRRLSYNSGGSWESWLIGETNNNWTTYYVSKSGSDKNVGTSSEYPFATIAQALRVASGTGCGSSSQKVQLCLGEGDWGDLILLGLPFQLEIYPYDKTNATAYSTSLPKFGTLTISNSFVILHSIVVDKLAATQSAYCMIGGGYKRIACITCSFQSTVSFASSNSTTNLWEIHQSSLSDSVINVSYDSRVALNGYLHLKLCENVTHYAFLIISGGYFSAYQGRTVVDNSEYTFTGDKFILYNGAEVRTRESNSPGNFLQSLPGTAYQISNGAFVNGFNPAVATVSALNNVDASAVHLTGDETIAGNKTFTDAVIVANTNPTYWAKDTNLERGVLPSSAHESLTFILADNNNRRVGGLFQQFGTDGTVKTSLIAYQGNTTDNSNAQMGVAREVDGTSYGFAPKTPANSSGGQIVTANYLQGDLTLNGTKTFTVSPIIKRANPYLDFQETDISETSGPSSTSYSGIRFYANEKSAALTSLLSHKFKDGSTMVRLVVRNEADTGNIEYFDSLAIFRSANGVCRAYAPHPSDSSNETMIATTKWVRDRLTISTAAPSGGTDGDIWFQY